MRSKFIHISFGKCVSVDSFIEIPRRELPNVLGNFVVRHLVNGFTRAMCPLSFLLWMRFFSSPLASPGRESRSSRRYEGRQ